MSNRLKLRQLNRTSGKFQRPKFTWSGQIGNRTAQAQLREQEEEAKKPRLILQPKGR